MDFLVYEHWRPDTGVCFYVGKGKRKRSRTFEHRNSRYGRIVSKLSRAGLVPIIKIVAQGMTETEAFALEVNRIAFWRAAGVEIANYTDGGDGPSGHRHSEATRDKIRKKAIGRVLSPETIAKMVQSRTGRKHSDATIEKMRQSARRVQPAAQKAACSTKAGRKKMLAMSRNAAADPAVRLIRSVNAKALWADPAYRAKVLEARVSRTVIKGFS